MTDHRFLQCDVFSPTPTRGNGLAVVLDAEVLTDEQMQFFARWTNLAETTFLLPPTVEGADYKVRIFTPQREMLFAGHPTLGSCAAWLHAGGQPNNSKIVRQECAIGVIDVDVSQPGEFAFKAPPTDIQPLSDEALTAICTALEIPRQSVVNSAHLHNGPFWQALELESAEAVLAVDSSRVQWPAFSPIGLIGPHTVGSNADFEVRMLAPSSNMSEDPITGSLNAALAHWLQAQGRAAHPLRVAQGTVIGREGRVSIRPDAGAMWIGGQVHILIDGRVRF
ncbi:PhzF family phenazine biosynthesis protein [Nitrincola sp. MINF-07-Sa-05]|uniref:PhzF family phenazine biosynthesis protein n=1 Tax=Nitrincola salilacus TaxID=3400273 RepID=UPI003917D15A